jgi:hypothetical protein
MVRGVNVSVSVLLQKCTKGNKTLVETEVCLFADCCKLNRRAPYNINIFQVIKYFEQTYVRFFTKCFISKFIFSFSVCLKNFGSILHFSSANTGGQSLAHLSSVICLYRKYYLTPTCTPERVYHISFYACKDTVSGRSLAHLNVFITSHFTPVRIQFLDAHLHT